MSQDKNSKNLKNSKKTGGNNLLDECDAKPSFGAVGFDDEENDTIQFRSMAAVLNAPAFAPFHGISGANPSSFLMTPSMDGPVDAFSSALRSISTKSKPQPTSSTASTASEAETVPRPRSYQGVKARDLPPPPFRLEKHTQFPVAQSFNIQRTCSVIERKLIDLKTKFTFDQEKCKWKVSTKYMGQDVSFIIGIFVIEESNEFLVEVQRRDGDVVGFMDFYKSLHEFCSRNQLISHIARRKN